MEGMKKYIILIAYIITLFLFCISLQAGNYYWGDSPIQLRWFDKQEDRVSRKFYLQFRIRDGLKWGEWQNIPTVYEMEGMK